LILQRRSVFADRAAVERDQRGSLILAGLLGVVCACEPKPAIKPSIELTSLPPAGEGSPDGVDPIAGIVGVRVVVRDDGSGIDPEVLQSGRDGHWGPPGMRERAEKLGGRLSVWSKAEAGTEVELSVPGNLAFAASAKTLAKALER
jgi:signal transduction histidine kinase